MKQLIVAVAVCSLALTGCSRQPVPAPEAEETVAEVSWGEVAVVDMNETQKAQHELVLAATNALVSETLGELEAALSSGGGAGGIEVCREKAPLIAAHVSEQFGLKIGRTSHRLRNPNNTPPEWAQPFVADLADEPVFLAGPNGELGALLPIRLKGECQMCHGPVETIDDEILTAIAAVYPSDQAVGFFEGDLRGWFWVEAPPGEAEVSI
jgi:hypothetical protein